MYSNYCREAALKYIRKNTWRIVLLIYTKHLPLTEQLVFSHHHVQYLNKVSDKTGNCMSKQSREISQPHKIGDLSPLHRHRPGNISEGHLGCTWQSLRLNTDSSESPSSSLTKKVTLYSRLVQITSPESQKRSTYEQVTQAHRHKIA